MSSVNSFGAKAALKVGDTNYTVYSIAAASKALGTDLSKLPYSLKILLENLLRYEDGRRSAKKTSPPSAPG